MTDSGTWVPPGPSKYATARPSSTSRSDGNWRRSAATSKAVIRGCYRPAGVAGAGGSATALRRADGLPGRLGRGPRLDCDLVRRDVDLELDVVPDEPAAGLERHVPVEAPVLAVDLRFGGESGVAATAHPRRRAEVFDVERHGPRLAADRDIARDAEFAIALWPDPGRTEDDPAVRLGVEEVGRPKMLVAGVEPRREARSVHPDLAARSGRLGFVELQLSLDHRELAADGRDHHVLRRERNVGVGGVDLPGGHGGVVVVLQGGRSASRRYSLTTQPYSEFVAVSTTTRVSWRHDQHRRGPSARGD